MDISYIPCGDRCIDTPRKSVRHGKFPEVIIHGASLCLISSCYPVGEGGPRVDPTYTLSTPGHL